MSLTYSQHKPLLDGEITIFILASSTKGIWQVRFRNPLSSSPRYIRKSTGHKSEHLATARAVELYNEFNSRAMLGLRHGATTIHDLVENYSPQMSVVMKKATHTLYETYWTKFFGEDDLSKYSSSDVTDYFRWKIDNRDELRKDIRGGFRASEDSISADTLKLERNCLSWLFRAGYADQRIPRVPVFPKGFQDWDEVHCLPRNKRRGRFDPKEDYQKILIPEFNRIRKGLLTEKWKPVLLDQEQKHNQETNPWISIAKRDVEVGRDKRPSEFCTKKSRYPTSVFWFASLLLANSGVRVSELVKLRHRDIQVVEDEDGTVFTVINIDREVSKIRKHRDVICADFQHTFKRYLIYKMEWEYYFNRPPRGEDYIFPQPKGKGRMGPRLKLGNLFRPNLVRLGLSEKVIQTRKGHSVRVYFSAYSFRSFYISQRLQNGLDIYTLSKNVGSSVKTIASTYDYNENWLFRKAMTKHLHERKSDKLHPRERHQLADHLRDWKLK